MNNVTQPSNSTARVLPAQERLQILNAENHADQHTHTYAYVLLVVLFACQLGVAAWQKFYPRSFNVFSLFGLWLVPLFLNIQSRQFLLLWSAFSLANLLIVRKAFERPLKSTTPALVYKWFALVYSSCYFIGIFAYVLMLCAMFRIPDWFGGLTLQWDITLMQVSPVELFITLFKLISFPSMFSFTLCTLVPWVETLWIACLTKWLPRSVITAKQASRPNIYVPMCAPFVVTRQIQNR